MSQEPPNKRQRLNPLEGQYQVAKSQTSQPITQQKPLPHKESHQKKK